MMTFRDCIALSKPSASRERKRPEPGARSYSGRLRSRLAEGFGRAKLLLNTFNTRSIPSKGRMFHVSLVGHLLCVVRLDGRRRLHAASTAERRKVYSSAR